VDLLTIANTQETWLSARLVVLYTWWQLYDLPDEEICVACSRIMSRRENRREGKQKSGEQKRE
jgi:hypothetical protein